MPKKSAKKRTRSQIAKAAWAKRKAQALADASPPEWRLREGTPIAEGWKVVGEPENIGETAQQARASEREIWLKSQHAADLRLVTGAIAELEARMPLPQTVVISSWVLCRMIDVLNRHGVKADQA